MSNAALSRILIEQAAQQRDQGGAQQDDAASRHELFYDADLEDISQRQEQLWEGVREILTQLSKLS